MYQIWNTLAASLTGKQEHELGLSDLPALGFFGGGSSEVRGESEGRFRGLEDIGGRVGIQIQRVKWGWPSQVPMLSAQHVACLE